MTLLSRAEFLRATLGGVLMLPGVTQSNAPREDGREQRVARLLEAFDAQGLHRTATDVDDRSGRWLADVVRSGGAEARLDPFSIRRVDIRSAFVEAGGKRVDGVPFFDGSFTDAQGVTGRLGAEIGLTTIDQAGISSEGQALAALRRSPDIRAIVGITTGGRPGLSLSNAASFSSPYGVPVLQVSSTDGTWLNDLAASKHDVQVVADAVRTPAQAFNVVGSVAGRDTTLGPLVIMTPRSGWWHCASERGGGLACWVEAIRAVAAAKPRRPVMAIASSGHELGHFGLDAFLAKQPGLIKRATWIHLGANIGAEGAAPRLQASDDAIEAMADDALSKAGAEVRQRMPRGTRPAGEARNIHDGGGRYVSLLSAQAPSFHNVADRWPATVDVASAARFCQAFADLAVRLAG